MGLKLYGVPPSTCTSRALACLYEKDVDFELVPVNIMTGEQKQPHFLSKNPFGVIPVLEDGDLTLFESRAITQYVAHKYKDQGVDLVRHENIKEGGLVTVWIEVESQNYSPAISPLVYQNIVAPMFGKTPDQAVIDANVEKLGKVLDVYEARLSSTKYLAGDFYSLADLHHFPYTYYVMKTPQAELINSRPHVKAWWDDISSRPALKKVAEGMNLS